MTGTWRPAPATKPAHLSSSNTASAQTLAALQGATSAFASTPSDIVSNVKVQHSGPSRFSTTSSAYQNPRGRQFGLYEQYNGERSPSRGRHLEVKKAYLAGARAATSNASSQAPSLRPTTFERSSSRIAARLASSTSSSPARKSPAASPRRGPNSFPDSEQPPKDASTNEEAASFKAQASSRAVTDSEAPIERARVNKTALNFEQVPQLIPSQRSPVPVVSKRAAGNSGDKVNDETSTVVVPPATDVVTPRRNSTTAIEPKQGEGIHPQKSKASEPSQIVATRISTPQSGTPDVYQAVRTKPAIPAPRRTHGNLLRSPLEPNRTGPLPGETREQAISRLADAMVASSLASTRSPSPMKVNHMASVKSSRRSSSVSDLRHSTRSPAQPTTLDTYQNMSSNSQRPPRPMKQTLRKHSSDKEEDDSAFEPTKRGRRHLVRKHPNMHHEGDRKRWRDKVTELERKRYEGVFAANRGLLLKTADPRSSPSKMIDPYAENNQVVNVVVRDIWERSRLNKEVLREVYLLVAPEEPTSLNREQFVVGLWLIDQKLKGRKLPVTVSHSVWASVRHSTGIKIHRGT